MSMATLSKTSKLIKKYVIKVNSLQVGGDQDTNDDENEGNSTIQAKYEPKQFGTQRIHILIIYSSLESQSFDSVRIFVKRPSQSCHSPSSNVLCEPEVDHYCNQDEFNDDSFPNQASEQTFQKQQSDWDSFEHNMQNKSSSILDWLHFSIFFLIYNYERGYPSPKSVYRPSGPLSRCSWPNLSVIIINKRMKNPVRKAASLILCRDSHKLTSFFNYELLILQRKSALKEWGSMMVFPGGKYDPKSDDQLVTEFGFKKPAIATALRECFEQTGIFISQHPLLQTQKIKQINDLRLKFLASQIMNSDNGLADYFGEISRVLPPVNDLLSFIRLITVPIIKQRFDASFFIQKLQPYHFLNFLKYAEDQKYIHEQNQIIMCREYSRCEWSTPIEVLQKFRRKEIKLPPPQFIMLNIMSNFQKYDDLIYYLKECSQNPNNTGPNVVSMITNNGYLKEKFPYAATLMGDSQFPFQNCIQNESNDYLIEELKAEKEKPKGEGKNRFLFKKPLQFFEDEYSCECTVEGSILNRFQDSQKLQQTLQNYQ